MCRMRSSLLILLLLCLVPLSAPQALTIGDIVVEEGGDLDITLAGDVIVEVVGGVLSGGDISFEAEVEIRFGEGMTVIADTLNLCGGAGCGPDGVMPDDSETRIIVLSTVGNFRISTPKSIFVANVPEPSTALLLIIGLAGLAGRRR